MSLSILSRVLMVAWVQPSEYAFFRLPLDPAADGYASSYSLEIRRVHGTRPVFRQTYRMVDSPAFDRSGRLLAFTDQTWVFVWMARGRIRRFRIPKLPDGSSGEGIYPEGGLLWSPDSRRLLIWIPGSQGSMILGHGELSVLELRTGLTRFIESVARPRWVSWGTIEYWQFHHDERQMSYYSVNRLDLHNPRAKPQFLRWEFPDWLQGTSRGSE